MSQNRTHFEGLVAELRALEQRLRAGGGPDKVERQHKQGKLTARERIAALSREFGFYPWGPAGSGEARFVCSWDTPDEDVDALCSQLRTSWKSGMSPLFPEHEVGRADQA